eukprot:TRINITY_DN23108_c0_g1_i1.p1 TRINITY_DN23108_c0_g1~~TRINITY_DN23108_c0_g1_i1.p1  ORF type:complete len:409 (+),score=131.09 TRINITY_DN23108_c0_g1_i1:113-1228(+)
MTAHFQAEMSIDHCTSNEAVVMDDGGIVAEDDDYDEAGLGYTGESQFSQEELEIQRQIAMQHTQAHAQHNAPLLQPGSEVAKCLKMLARDELDFLVLGESSGWTPEIIIRQAIPLLFTTRNVREVVLIDLVHNETVAAVCAALCDNPTITALGLIVTSSDAAQEVQHRLTLAGVEPLCELIAYSKSLNHLFINNALHHLVDVCTEHLARALCHSRSLEHLNLESNGIHDGALLPLGRALAAQRSIKVLNLNNNSVGYEGLEIMSEVMSYNRHLVNVKIDGNLVRRPLDTWEGFTLMEQCKVNKEMARIGVYARANHMKWPRLFRRKMNRLWFVWKHLNTKVDETVWEYILGHIDPRGYINQKVRLWMKQQR